ncbi:hypothetical protein [Kitasatospora purpeofusca]|uniref:hypothetical protein n=1 Tax=Kitasatospora purpeofusca TaxID=67352 RepID=UPI003F4A8A47
MRSVGKAQEKLSAALSAAVEEKQEALALSRRVQPGRSVVDVTLDLRGLREPPQWYHLTAVRGRIREAVVGLGQADL